MDTLTCGVDVGTVQAVCADRRETWNDADEADEGHDGHIYQVSVGYTFSNGLGLSIGYQKSDEENEEKERIGTLVSYSYDF